MNRLTLSALWIEGSLSYIEKLCLTSAQDMGHRVILYTYHGCSGVPEGVDVRDGREIMPETMLVKHHKKQSYALASDLFRYFLLAREDTCYIDCDVLFLKPLEDREYIYGWQDDRLIASGILRAPRDSELINSMIEFATRKYIVAPWWKKKKKIIQHVRSAVGIGRTIEHLEWGTIGPRAVTWFARHHAVDHHASRPDVFYPVPYQNAKAAFDPGSDVARYFTPKTIATHLWNELIKELKTQPAPPGSFVANQCQKYGIEMDNLAIHYS